MAMDMVVALGQATVGSQTLFGLNTHAVPGTRRYGLVGHAGRNPALGEKIATDTLPLLQGRDCWALVGAGWDGAWGLTHGCNEQGVVMGRAGWKSRVDSSPETLLGTDLVRVVLERAHNAQQGAEILTDLISRHGQRYSADAADVFTDNVFLIADAREALLVEAAGRHWALLECRRSRAVSDAALIRQDWQRVSHELAPEAVRLGWWKDDGNKLDFGGLLGEGCPVQTWALQRWGRATLLLEQQDGRLDLDGLRMLLDEHFDTAIDKFPGPLPPRRLGNFLVVVAADHPAVPVAWCGIDLAGVPLHFPVLPGGILPEGLLNQGNDAPHYVVSTPDVPAAADQEERFHHWQGSVEEELARALPEVRQAHDSGDREAFQRLASGFMRARWLELDALLHPEGRPPIRPTLRDEIAYVAE